MAKRRDMTPLEARVLAAVVAERRAWEKWDKAIKANARHYPQDEMAGCRKVYARWHKMREAADRLADELLAERGLG